MPQTFIVRPFGNRPVLKKKAGKDEYEKELYDFDNVEKVLIRPAMAATGLIGGTTGEVFAAGDIREDMFSSLLVDDLIIADITVHNANVFYELGIRHALRDRHTILIKGQGYDETPFDIIGYRYISYDKDHPEKALDSLIQAIKETLDPQKRRKDSPVFNVLPALEPQDAERFMAVPEDFIREVTLAVTTRDIGWLRLLTKEVERMSWNRPAFRLIGNGFFNAKAYRPARSIFEWILQTLPLDRQANDRLATIYQRLAEEELAKPQRDALLAKSDLAIKNLLDNNALTNNERAEALSLKARNAKIRWLYAWKDQPDLELRQKNALGSLDLTRACELYDLGFTADLNHYYSGINALALMLVTIKLAEKHPDVWRRRFDKNTNPDLALEDIRNKYNSMVPTEELSIRASIARACAADPLGRDVWAEITYADFLCLTSDDPETVGYRYQQATSEISELNREAIVRQLRIYESLDLLPANVKAAIDNISLSDAQKPKYIFLFTGHMIDKPGRTEPRFPASREQEIKERIRAALRQEKTRLGEAISIAGIAGGACGGDILFHEVCHDLDIPTTIHLALPEEQFVIDSVKFAGNDWLTRFKNLFDALPHPIINEKGDLPNWLKNQNGYTVWSRNNLWELYSALAIGGKNVTLFALWNEKDGDGPGGTADMVAQAKNEWANFIHLPI